MSIRSVCRKSLQMKVWALKSGWWAALVVLCHINTPHGLKSVTSHLYAQRVWTHWEGGCSTWNHLFIQNVNKSVNKVGSLYAQRHFPPTIPSPLHKSSLHPLYRFIILTLPPRPSPGGFMLTEAVCTPHTGFAVQLTAESGREQGKNTVGRAACEWGEEEKNDGICTIWLQIHCLSEINRNCYQGMPGIQKNKIKLLEQWREVGEQTVCNKKKTCVDFVLAVRLKRGFVPGWKINGFW